MLLVGFGQQICEAKNPKCLDCKVLEYCKDGPALARAQKKKMEMKAKKEAAKLKRKKIKEEKSKAKQEENDDDLPPLEKISERRSPRKRVKTE